MVKKVFMTLVTIVACVVLGALILNTVLPNTAIAMVDATEDMIYNATGMSFNMNGNSKVGGTNDTGKYDSDVNNAGNADEKDGKVKGFKSGTTTP